MNKIYQYSVRRTPMDTKSQTRKARLSYFCYEHQNRVWLFGDFRCGVLLFMVILVTLCLHYVPGDHGSPNVARRGILDSLSWYSSSGRYHYVFSRSVKVSVTNCGLKRATEPRRPDGALRLSPRSVTDACTFPPSLPRSDRTYHVSFLYNQGLPRLSNSAKAHYC